MLKSVVIEAIQFNDMDSYLEIVAWMKSCGYTMEVRYSRPIMLLQSLEGTIVANPGDWIVRGAIEFYTCKADVFESVVGLSC